jgi:formamidopyrimidine-DNA glycosylase
MTVYYLDQSPADTAYPAYDSAPVNEYGTPGQPCARCGKPLTDVDTQRLNPHHLCKPCALHDRIEASHDMHS